jgi:hypothetical protein
VNYAAVGCAGAVWAILILGAGRPTRQADGLIPPEQLHAFLRRIRAGFLVLTLAVVVPGIVIFAMDIPQRALLGVGDLIFAALRSLPVLYLRRQ